LRFKHQNQGYYFEFEITEDDRRQNHPIPGFALILISRNNMTLPISENSVVPNGQKRRLLSDGQCNKAAGQPDYAYPFLLAD
jgi:hypothetical protein